MFGNGGKDVEREPGGVRIIAGHELYPGIHQGGDESHVAAQAVHLGDDELGLELLAGRERGGELRPVVAALAGLHLDELLRERPAPAVEIGLDRLALRLDAEA